MPVFICFPCASLVSQNLSKPSISIYIEESSIKKQNRAPLLSEKEHQSHPKHMQHYASSHQNHVCLRLWSLPRPNRPSEVHRGEKLLWFTNSILGRTRFAPDGTAETGELGWSGRRVEHGAERCFGVDISQVESTWKTTGSSSLVKWIDGRPIRAQRPFSRCPCTMRRNTSNGKPCGARCNGSGRRHWNNGLGWFGTKLAFPVPLRVQVCSKDWCSLTLELVNVCSA